MPTRRRREPTKRPRRRPGDSARRPADAARVDGVLAALERRGTKRNREGMARYGIVAPKVFGVSVATIRQIAKPLGRDHELAAALWDTGWY